MRFRKKKRNKVDVLCQDVNARFSFVSRSRISSQDLIKLVDILIVGVCLPFTRAIDVAAVSHTKTTASLLVVKATTDRHMSDFFQTGRQMEHAQKMCPRFT